MITEKDTEREKSKKSLETKINMLEGQLRNADHENQILNEEKVNITVFTKKPYTRNTKIRLFGK